MIPVTEVPVQKDLWQIELGQMIRSHATLVQRLGLPPEDSLALQQATKQFAIKVTPTFLAKMRPNDPTDPLLLQVLAQGHEMESMPGYVDDPLDEAGHIAAPGLIHKYHGRVLMVSNHSCAVHCRYCFRRTFDYQSHQLNAKQWAESLRYIQKHPEIEELILSGGDPLMNKDAWFESVVEPIAKLPQIQRIRIHSRLISVLPSRFTDALLQRLASWPVQLILVHHINHANEVDDELVMLGNKLRQMGFINYNQSVLLKDVNDQLETQIALHKAVFQAGIQPYYLHLLDPVTGIHHFDVDKSKAKALMTQLRSRLPGFMVPQLVKELAGKKNKTPVNDC